MQDLASILERIAITLDQMAHNQSQMLEALQSIDLKLGAASGAMGLDDIYNEFVVIRSSIGSIEASISSIDHNTAMIEINTAS